MTDLARTDLTALGARYEGKVRDVYDVGDERVLLVATDRISAFDRVLGTVPYKGQVLNRLSAHWFDATRSIADNHVLAVPDANVTLARKTTPLAVEFVVRAYLTGVTSTSIWSHYARGERTYCGHTLPEGLRQHGPLPTPLVTPTTKAPAGQHDVPMSRAALIAGGHIDAETFDRAAALALAVFARGSERCAERGLVLVDTKYEFGRTRSGELLLIDEIHTPDSSRFWRRDGLDARVAAGEAPEALDKEHLRRWLAANGYSGEGTPPALDDAIREELARRYASAFEQITGTVFEPDRRPFAARVGAIEAALRGEEG